MGREIVCTGRMNGQASEGKLHLDTDLISFRGDFRLKIAFSEVSRVEATNGLLEIEFNGIQAEFEVGPTAEKWAVAIKNPKSRCEKLGVKQGMRVAVLGTFDSEFHAELLAREAAGASVEESEIVFLEVGVAGDLAQVELIKSQMSAGAALWIVYPKGRLEITEAGVINSGRSAGMTDTRVVRFSETHTALRFVARKIA